MSLTPPPPVTRRDWTFPIIAGVVAIVVVLAVCLLGTAMAFVSLRDPSVPDPGASGQPAPSVGPTQRNVGSGPECLIGDWAETNYALTTLMGTSQVRLTGKGAASKFSTDGTLFQLYQNVTYAGSADGNTYEVVVNGSLMVDYEADATTIRYSNPVTLGTTTLKINGVVDAWDKLEASLTPESYTCQGNKLRLTGEGTVTELQRIS
jgi:hypothetical protein